MADGSIRIDTKINNKGAEQGLNELKQLADTKVKQLEKGVASAGNEVNKLNQKFTETSQKLAEVENQMDAVANEVAGTYSDFQGAMSADAWDTFITGQINANAQYQQLQSQQMSLVNKVEEYSQKLAAAKSNQEQLNSSLELAKSEQTSINQKIADSDNKTKSLSNNMKNVSNNTKKVSTHSLGISNSIGSAVKNLAKYAVALLGFQTIYNMLKSSVSEWLNGSSQEAQQLQADITNLKNNIGSALAPAVQSVLNIFYKILAVVGAIVKAFTSINIFAKNTAKSSASTATSTKQTSNNLASWDSLNVLNQDSDSGSSSGDSSVEPTDLSSLMSEYEELAEKIKDIFSTVLDPFKQAWETTGQTVIDAMYNALYGVKSLILAIGSSFEKIWTNGTVQTTIELILNLFADILNIIGNISRALADAWNNNNNGDQLVQNLANAFNNLLYIVESVFKTFEEWTSSESFQTFANSFIEICKTLSEWIELITAKLKEIWENGGQETFTKLLEFISKLTEAISVILDFLSPVIEYILDIVTPIISGIVTAIGYVIDALSGVLDFIIGIFTGDWERAWQGISDFFTGIWNAIKTIIETIWNAIVSIIETAINLIKTVITTVFNAISTVISTIWNAIKSTVSSVWNGITSTISSVVNTIKTTISNVLNSVKSTWSSIWTSIKTTVTNIWNSIWSSIKSVINSILAGIESFVNGIIKGINKVLSAISSVANAVGSLIGLSPISLQLSTISLPRLAKGGIVNQPTQAIVGEAGKEAILPLENNTEWMDTLAEKIANILLSSSDNDSGRDITINFDGTLSQLIRILKPELDKESTRKGDKLIIGGTS